jgi:transposase InsO family protein
MAGERLQEALERFRRRYRAASRRERSGLLDEVCKLTGYHRKYVIGLLGRREEKVTNSPRRPRRPTYSKEALAVLEAIWRAAGYPWSVRLKAIVRLWLPWARKHLRSCTPEVEPQLLAISPRQVDRRLALCKRRRKRRLYGRTKPGSLLRYQVPIRGEAPKDSPPGYTEVDLVSHSGPSARGEFAYTLNLTDLASGWCESRAVLGRGQEAVLAALQAIRATLPFPLLALHSDNGSEFLNHHLIRYCEQQQIRYTRSRPYKKDDNGRIEQKNWTHVRRIWGWDRYDTPHQVRAMNDLYTTELPRMMNLFQPSVKLVETVRRGSRLSRRYEPPKTPLDRLADAAPGGIVPPAVEKLLALRKTLDPFQLSAAIERKVGQTQPTPNATTFEPHRAARSAGPPTASLSPERGRPSQEKSHASR